jgi:hypothetical protein
MNCAGSVNLTADVPNSAGPAAWLGTAAHKVIETMLQNNETDATEYHGRVILVHIPGEEETLILAPGAPIPPENLKAAWHMFVCDDDMVAGVQMMIDEVERWKEIVFDPMLYTERFLDGAWLDPRLGGTADVTLVEPGGWIHLFDYKNGRVIVEVKDNEQMKNYGVFLLHEHPDATGVHVHLVQPNASHEDGCIRDEKYTADELKLFEITLKEAADATTPKNAPLRAGDWCTYCAGKDMGCEAYEALMRQEAFVDFAEDPAEPIPTPELVELDEEEPAAGKYADGDEYREALARRARWIPLMDQSSRDIRGKILAELTNGHAVGDWKLVRGKSNRMYPDEAAAQQHFNENGISDDHLFNAPELKSPAQVEKLGKATGIKTAVLKKIVAEVAIKPPGKISIAPGTDARQALDPGAVIGEDFADDPAEDFAP